METCYEATNTNPNSIYIPIKICLEGYNQYELTAYIDSGCSIQVKIADNSIMSHNEAIEGLNIEIGGVQCAIPVL